MENQSEIEQKILAVLKEQFKKDGGNNGIHLTCLDHILNLPAQERNEFLERMTREKKVHIFESLNTKRITLPK